MDSPDLCWALFTPIYGKSRVPCAAYVRSARCLLAGEESRMKRNQLIAFLIVGAALRRDFGGSSFLDGYVAAVRVEHFILGRIVRG